jgi:hypothetical protein
MRRGDTMNMIELKQRLVNIKENSVDLTTEEISELSNVMLNFIGSTDSELRDGLIYSFFSTWIREKRFSEEKLSDILLICLDNNHLFLGLGEVDTDTVFTRSFAILIIATIIYYHNHESSFLTVEELKNASKRVLTYAIKEQDLRGFVTGKGWAHSVAHMADCLDEIAQCSLLGREQLEQILTIIQTKMKNKQLIFAFGEDERMVTPALSVIKRNILREEEIIQWLERFVELEISFNFPNDYWYIVNIKLFLRSFYFRTLNAPSLRWVNQPISKLLEEIPRKFPEY